MKISYVTDSLGALPPACAADKTPNWISYTVSCQNT